MEFFRRTWAQILAFLQRLTIAERWLMVVLAAFLLVVGMLMIQWWSKPALVPITAFATDRPAEVVARLKAAGIEVENRSGQLLVASDKQQDALAVLQRSELMNPDTAAAFDQMIARQTPWMTNAQNRQQMTLAKQKVLSQIIAKMNSVKSADVMISIPDDRGFGTVRTRPTASVTLIMQGAHRVDKALVQAVAGMVSGAVSEMKPQDVTVIDARLGRSFNVKDPTEMAPGEAQELVQQIESYQREKIAEALSYIPGVMVAVNVQTDPTRHRQVEQMEYEKNEPLKSEETKETERKQVTEAAEPGARSNVGLEIAGGQAPGSSEKTNSSRSEFGVKQPTRKVSAIETGHSIQQINVSVNVPRSYFLRLYRQGKPDAKEEPDEATLAPIIQTQLTQIQSQIEPLIAASNKGVVHVAMIPDTGSVAMALAAGGSGASGGGLGSAGAVGELLSTDWLKPAFLGLLSLGSLAMMFFMVKKSTQHPKMPTIEELAGVPPELPALQNEEDLIGEAEETEPSMAGVELDEDEIRRRRLIEQIAEMIKGNPAEAASLIRKWVRTEE